MSLEPLEPRTLFTVSGLTGAITSTTPSPLSFFVTQGGTASGSAATTVTITGAIRSNVDVFFLADTTGSMGSLIGSVQSTFKNIASNLATALPGSDLHFGVADFKDISDGGTYATTGIKIDQALTSDNTAVQTAINGWSADGGGDAPEENIWALDNLALNWLSDGGRSDAQKIIIYVSDVSGWENGAKGGGFPTLSKTITDLKTTGIGVYALDNGGAGTGLDAPGSSQSPGGPADGRNQGSAITTGTGGQIFYNVSFSDSSGIASTIETAITTGVDTVSNISLRLDGDPGPWNILLPDSPYIGPFASKDSPINKKFTVTVIAPSTFDTRSLSLTLLADGVPLDSTPLSLTDKAPLVAGGIAASGVEGTPVTAVPLALVATTDPIGNLTAFIDWGDKSVKTVGVISVNPSGGYIVSGSHTYVDEGTYIDHVQIFDTDGETALTGSAIKIADAPLVGTPAADFTVNPSTTFSSTLGTFSDTNPAGKLLEYSGSIDWGDGSFSTASLKPDPAHPGQFLIAGSHRYGAKITQYTVKITIVDKGGAMLTMSLHINITPPGPSNNPKTQPH